MLLFLLASPLMAGDANAASRPLCHAVGMLSGPTGNAPAALRRLGNPAKAFEFLLSVAGPGTVRIEMTAYA